MGYTALTLKYRPQRLEDAVGQKHIVKTLRNAIKLDRIGHAYLFIGPAGTGKTSFARIWAKEMNCPSKNPPCCSCLTCREISEGRNLDVIELNAADKRKIEDIRDSLVRLRYRPSSKYKILILDEAHMLTTEAWNALLKDLEEPLDYVIFILCTTNPEKIPKTILSRCQTFQFRSVETDDVMKRLAYICDEEGFEYSDQSLRMIADYSKGGMRDAVSALEQTACFNQDDISVEGVIETLGLIPSETVESMLSDIKSGDVDSCVETLNGIISDGGSVETLFSMMSERYREMIHASFQGNGELSKLECFKISRIMLEYDKLLRNSSDSFYTMLCMINALVTSDETDISSRLSQIEKSISNGLTSPTIVSSPVVANIKAKLESLDKKPDKPDSNDDLFNSLLSMSGGRQV